MTERRRVPRMVLVAVSVAVAVNVGCSAPTERPIGSAALAPSGSGPVAIDPTEPIPGPRYGPGANLRLTAPLELAEDWTARSGQTLSVVALRPSVAGRSAYVVQHWGDLVTGLRPETVVATVDTMIVDAVTEPAERACPDEIRTIEDVAGLEPWNRAACFGDGRIVLPGVRRETYAVMIGDPPWLAGTSGPDFLTALPFAEADGLTIPKGPWLDVAGHFEDSRCADDDLTCRQRFVATSFTDAAPPPDEWVGTWERLPDAPIPRRQAAVAAWTGAEMVVWGGGGPAASTPDGDPVDARIGAAYDPVTGRWRTIAASPMEATMHAFATWTGEAILVWGGWRADTTSSASGAIYDPGTDRWRPLPDAPVAGWEAAWTSAGLVVIAHDGTTASLDSSGRRWTVIAEPLSQAPGIWRLRAVGDHVLLFHAPDGERAAVQGWRLRDDRTSWEPLAPTTWRALEMADEVVAGDDRLYAVASYGGQTVDGLSGSVAYDPASDTWEHVGACQMGLAQVWTGTRLVGTHGAFEPATGRCLTLPMAPDRPGEAYPDRDGPVSVWTGVSYVLWGGSSMTTNGVGDGIAFTPAGH